MNGSDIVSLLETIGRKHSDPVAVMSHVAAVCGPAPAIRARLMLTEDKLRVLLQELTYTRETNALCIRIAEKQRSAALGNL